MQLTPDASNRLVELNSQLQDLRRRAPVSKPPRIVWDDEPVPEQHIAPASASPPVESAESKPARLEPDRSDPAVRRRFSRERPVSPSARRARMPRPAARPGQPPASGPGAASSPLGEVSSLSGPGDVTAPAGAAELVGKRPDDGAERDSEAAAQPFTAAAEGSTAHPTVAAPELLREAAQAHPRPLTLEDSNEPEADVQADVAGAVLAPGHIDYQLPAERERAVIVAERIAVHSWPALGLVTALAAGFVIFNLPFLIQSAAAWLAAQPSVAWLLATAGQAAPASRAVLAAWFLLVCPGMAVARLLPIGRASIEWTVAVIVSLALDGLLALGLTSPGWWSLDRSLAILVTVSAALWLAHLFRRRMRLARA